MRAILACLVLLLATLPAAAQEVLVIDQGRIFTESAFGKRVARDLEQQSRALTDENEKIAAALRAEEEQLTQDRATLPPAEFRKRADAFDQKAERIRAERASKLEALRSAQDAESGAFLAQIVPLLEKLVDERGASVLIDKRTVLITANAADITDEAIARIDAAIGDGTTPPE
ncbi:MAG: OmpH family outer membrane protein [Deltaproteobacteria bacterium]